MNHDAELSSIREFLRQIANRMAMEGQDVECAYVHTAIVNLRHAFSAEFLAEADRKDRERLEVLRAG